MCSYTVNGCCHFCLFLYYIGVILRQCWYRIAIYLIVILDKYRPVRLVSCVCMCVCHCSASVCFLGSMPSDLWRSFWLAWHCYETKSWSVVFIYWLISDFWNIWKWTSQRPNSSAHLGYKMYYILTVFPRLEMCTDGHSCNKKKISASFSFSVLIKVLKCAFVSLSLSRLPGKLIHIT